MALIFWIIIFIIKDKRLRPWRLSPPNHQQAWTLDPKRKRSFRCSCFSVSYSYINEVIDMIYESFCSEQTKKIAFDIAINANPSDIFCLNGDLGVGKTVFSKGFARGLGILDEITSPTFAIVNVYTDGRLPFYHFDVYRIENEYDMDDTGYEDYFYGDGVCLVEWAEKIKEIVPAAKWITIEKDLSKGEEYRKISVNGGNLK